MMESLHVAVAVLSLLSLGQTAPTTNCESLTQRIQIPGRDQLLGRWIYIAESTNIVGAKQLLEMSKGTVWSSYVAATEENIMIGSMHLKTAGLCFSMTFNSTLENNTLTLTYPYSMTGFQLKTGCPDCRVLYSNITLGRSSYRGVQLLSRRPKVSAAELQEFKKQVECLNLPEAAILDPEQGFCPDPSLSKDSNSFDLTSFMGAGEMKKISEILQSGDAVETFSELFSQISSTFGETVEN